MTRLKLKYLLFAACAFIILKVFGVFTHLFEKDFYNDFHYPYDGDIHESVEQLRHNQKPDIAPINMYDYTYITNCEHKCKSSDGEMLQPRLVYIVKSAVSHFSRRLAIRNTWGYEHRFSDVIIRTVFILGTDEDYTLIDKVNQESQKFGDIIQANFIDSYYNNTIKTMMGFKWAVTYCSSSKFYMFVDDDMYVSTKNVLRFVRNPTNYPAYLKEPIFSMKSSQNNAQIPSRLKIIKRDITNNLIIDQNLVNSNKSKIIIKETTNLTFQSRIINISSKQESSRQNMPNKYVIKEKEDLSQDIDNNHNNGSQQILDDARIKRSARINKNIGENSSTKKSVIKRQIMDFELPDDVRLYSGYVFISSPHRHISSKWHVPLEEYPYHMWPPYVTAGSYIVSKEALHELYYTSFYTKHFRFDDIYLGLVALKASIEPYHCTEFHFYKKAYSTNGYKFVISSHGYEDPEELLRVWNEQRSAGNA